MWLSFSFFYGLPISRITKKSIDVVRFFFCFGKFPENGVKIFLLKFDVVNTTILKEQKTK